MKLFSTSDTSLNNVRQLNFKAQHCTRESRYLLKTEFQLWVQHLRHRHSVCVHAGPLQFVRMSVASVGSSAHNFHLPMSHPSTSIIIQNGVRDARPTVRRRRRRTTAESVLASTVVNVGQLVGACVGAGHVNLRARDVVRIKLALRGRVT